MRSLFQRQQAGAIFAPAVQPTFSQGVAGNMKDRLLGSSGCKVSHLDFLKEGSAFDIGVFLTSAHVYRGKVGDITHRRRPGQAHIVDSGGYSLINSNIEATDCLARSMWEYQVKHADVALSLDVPLRTASAGKNSYYRTVDSCLKRTTELLRLYQRWNAAYSGRKPLWLNIVQLDPADRFNAWYNTVRHYPMDGWAFGGADRRNMALVTSHLFRMYRENRIPAAGWFHFLGMGGLNAFIALTAVRDGLRLLTGDHRITVSFDTAYPFNIVGRENRFIQMDDFGASDFGFKFEAIPSGMWAVGNDDLTCMKGPVLPWMTWNDVAYDPRWHPSTGKLDLGGFRNTLLFQNHNVWCVVTAFADVYDQLWLPKRERMLPDIYTKRYEYVRNLVASGSDLKLQDEWGCLSRIPA